MGLPSRIPNKVLPPNPLGTTNEDAAKHTRYIHAHLRALIHQSPERLRNACSAILAKAELGDVAAFNAIADRLDGKVGSGDNLLIRIVINTHNDKFKDANPSTVVLDQPD